MKTVTTKSMVVLAQQTVYVTKSSVKTSSRKLVLPQVTKTTYQTSTIGSLVATETVTAATPTKTVVKESKTTVTNFVNETSKVAAACTTR